MLQITACFFPAVASRFCTLLLLASLTLPLLDATAAVQAQVADSKAASSEVASPTVQQASALASAERRALVERLVLDRAAAIVALQREAEEREGILLARLTERDRELRVALAGRAVQEEELRSLRVELEEVTRERSRLVDQLGEQDRRLAAEIATYREQVASLADSPDPRKREALRRYADGDRSGAFDALVEIQQAETRALAAGWRELAALARDRRDRGEMTTAEVLPFLEQAQALDASNSQGWTFLGEIYHRLGRLEDAQNAARSAVEQAQGNQDLVSAWNLLGAVAVEAGSQGEGRDHYRRAHTLLLTYADDVEKHPGPLYWRAMVSIQLATLESYWGSLEEALELSRRSVETTRRLTERYPTSSRYQRHLSVAQRKLGDLLAKAGDLQAARREHLESLAILERLAQEYPESAERQRDLSIGWIQVGELERVSGSLRGAQSYMSSALELRRRLQQQDASSVRAKSDLAHALDLLTEVTASRGELQQAQDLIRESLELRRAILATNPQSAIAKEALAGTLRALAKTEVFAGRLMEARKSFEASLELRRSLSADESQNAEARVNLTEALVDLARVEWLSGQSGRSLALQGEACIVLTELRGKDPANADLSLRQARCQSSLGDRYATVGRLSDAEAQITDALSTLESLAQRDPSNILVTQQRGVLLQRAASLIQQRGDPAGAVPFLNRSVELFTSLTTGPATSPARQQELAEALGLRGVSKQKLGVLEAAGEDLQRSLEIFQELVETDSANANFVADYSDALQRLGKWFRAKGDFDAARQRLEEALEVSQGLSAKDPTHQKHRLRVGKLTLDLATVEAAAGRETEARRGLRRSRDLLEELAEQDPKNPRLQLDLASVWFALGSLAAQQSNYSSARSLLTEAVSIRQQLVDDFPGSALYRDQLATAHLRLGTVERVSRRYGTSVDHLLKAKAHFLQLVETSGGLPSAVRKLASAENELGKAEFSRGERSRAKTYWLEAAGRLTTHLAANTDDAKAQRLLLQIVSYLARYPDGESYADFGRRLGEQMREWGTLRAEDEEVLERIGKAPNSAGDTP
ncbi:MAG: tetratricopeptide repeat protein [Acidobacteriota bacterium]